MKILFIVATLTNGGAEKVVSNLTMNLPSDVDIDILVNSQSHKDYSVRGNIISLKMPHRTKKTLLYQIITFFKRYFKLKKLKKANNYTACISILDSANIVNILTGKKKSKIIITAHNTLSMQKTFEYKYIVYPMVRLLYNRADKIVCVSKGVMNDLKENFGIDSNILCTIYNGFECPASKIDIKTEANNLVSMGRLEKVKGFDHLIRATALAIKRNPKIRLHILGDGSLKKSLIKLTQDLKIEKNIIFHGFVNNPEEILRKADVFVFASTYEGFGNVLLEAMGLGLPVISTDYTSGAREILYPSSDLSCIIKDRYEVAPYGILTPVCKETSLDADGYLIEEKIFSDAILFLLESKMLREQLSVSGKKRAQEFSINTIVQLWMDILKS